MKKFLSILAVVLALCICLASCNMGGKKNEDVQANVGGGGSSSNNKVDGEGDKKPQGGSGDAKQAIIDAFAKVGNVEDLLGEIQNGLETEINLDEVYAEILMMQTEASFDFNATIDGLTGRVDGYTGTKNGEIVVNFGVNAENGVNESATAYGKFTEDMKFVLAACSGDSAGYETQVIDFGMYLNFDEMMGDMENAANGSVASMVAGFKLPELTKDDIAEQNGKYIISKDYWKKVVDYTLDTYIDTLRESGAEIDNEEFAEIKETAHAALDNVTVEIYFFMNGSAFEGFGINVEMDPEDLTAIMGENADDDFNGLDLKFEVKANEYVDFDMNVDSEEGSYICKCRVDFIMDGDTPAGFTMSVDANITDSYYSGSYDENGEYAGSNKVVQVTNVDADVTLDLTKLDKAGADVLVFNMNVLTTENGEADVDVDMSASIEAKGNNRFEYSFSYADAESSDDNVNAYGSFEFSETADNMPSIPSSAYDAMDEALANYVPGEGGILGGMGRPEAAPEDNWVEEEKMPA